MNLPPNEKQFSFAEDWEIPPIQPNSVEVGALPSPIWTETKAQLIQNYLRLFLFITRHGTYIDGFAGPQDSSNPESWAAKLVLELQPQWMNNFFLCERNRTSFAALEELVESQPEVRGRNVTPFHGDFNEWVDQVLNGGTITDSTATFALLDQRSTECHWSTIRKLAGHKKGGTKIELFYFFPTGWIHRTLSESNDHEALAAWWGDDTWRAIQDVNQQHAAMLASDKIKELGYREVWRWPISSREYGAGRTMYHMIHATDHLEAPKLMYRAYTNLIGNVPPDAQLNLDLGTRLRR